ncbi:hypothetical protein R1flu_026938 [Riccia fluitans]|uniref:Uncharacterized protein n=1 Tax=Riccia fluitans TaxID=41844 RepID=A0ABD1XHV1_9MARC
MVKFWWIPCGFCTARKVGYMVDPTNSHMLVSKIKPCNVAGINRPTTSVVSPPRHITRNLMKARIPEGMSSALHQNLLENQRASDTIDNSSELETPNHKICSPREDRQLSELRLSSLMNEQRTRRDARGNQASTFMNLLHSMGPPPLRIAPKEPSGISPIGNPTKAEKIKRLADPLQEDEQSFKEPQLTSPLYPSPRLPRRNLPEPIQHASKGSIRTGSPKASTEAENFTQPVNSSQEKDQGSKEMQSVAFTTSFSCPKRRLSAELGDSNLNVVDSLEIRRGELELRADPVSKTA